MTLPEPRPEIDDYIWSDLLDFIESGRVITIVDALQLGAEPDGEPLEAGIARWQSKVVLFPRLLGVLNDLEPGA